MPLYILAMSELDIKRAKIVAIIRRIPLSSEFRKKIRNGLYNLRVLIYLIPKEI